MLSHVFGRSGLWIGLAFAVLLTVPLAEAGAVRSLTACPFCPPSSPSWAEQLAESEAVLLVAWKGTEAEVERSLVKTHFQILDILRQTATSHTHQVGDRLTVPFLRDGQVGDWLVLFGRFDETDGWQWGKVLEVDEVAVGYLKRAPAPERPAEERLRYFLRFLEHSDPGIANDAFQEFSAARYEDVRALRNELPRERIRGWLQSEDASLKPRRGFYGLLLGLCGDATDREQLAQWVLPAPAPNEDRLGLDGLMAGYVLLAGRAGFEQLVATKLSEGAADADRLALLNVLRFCWDYGGLEISRPELQAALRLYLDDPALADLVIADLARWKDWSVQSRLIEQFGKQPLESIRSQSLVVQFMKACIRDQEEVADSPWVQPARLFLETIQRDRPELLRDSPLRR